MARRIRIGMPLAIATPVVALFLAWSVAPPIARAHGATVRVSYTGVRPSTLAIAAGTTVHFENANAGDGACTVVADDGSFKSPAMGRAEGWHHEFDTPGRFPFHIAEYGGVTGVILVGPRKEKPEKEP